MLYDYPQKYVKRGTRSFKLQIFSIRVSVCKVGIEIKLYSNRQKTYFTVVTRSFRVSLGANCSKPEMILYNIITKDDLVQCYPMKEVQIFSIQTLKVPPRMFVPTH